MIYTATASVDINQVGLGWTNTNFSTYMAGSIPSGEVLGFSANVDDTNYKIPNFDNWLQKGQLHNWVPGQALPDQEQLNETQVTITPIGRSTRVMPRNADRPMENRWEDLRVNIIPGLLSQAYQGIDKEIAAFLANSSNFGQISLTGTGAMDTFATDQRPFWDLLKQGVAPLRKYAASADFLKTVLRIDENVLDVFMSHFGFNPMGVGAAITSGTITDRAFAGGPSVTGRDAVISMFKQVLRLDEVFIHDAVGDTAKDGATSVPQELAYGLCWFGVEDRRPWDLTGKSPNGAKPDGALQLAFARRPEVKSGIPELSEQELFVARAEYQIFSPRGAAWGKLLPVASIFAP